MDRMEVEVISSGSSGIFSIFGGKKAKVRVRPIDKSHEDEMAKMMEEFSSNGSPKGNDRVVKNPEPKPWVSRAKAPEYKDTSDHKRPTVNESSVSPNSAQPYKDDSFRQETGTSENGRRAEDPKVVQVAQDVLSKLLAPLGQ